MNSQPTSVLSSLADLLDPPRLPWPDEPVRFLTERLDEFAWSKQCEILEAVRDNRRTAVRSCHGIGKSHIASRIAAWWLESFPVGEAFVVTTAAGFEQVRGVLWRYIGQLHRKAQLRGRVNQTEWWIGEEMVGFGRKPADNDPTALQGIHARRVLVILDEAAGVPRELWSAALSLASNDDSRVLAIGNPTDPGSYFAEVFKPDSGWHQIQIGHLDTPNFSGEAVPPDVAAELIGPLFVEDVRRDSGEGSPDWMARVLGEFPVDADDGVVPISAVRACQHADPVTYADDHLVPVELGWDVGAGGDRSVVRERRGLVAGRVWYPKGADTMAQCGEVLAAIEESGATAIKIDSIGIGHGVCDRMDELGRDGAHQARVVRVNVGEASSNPKRFPRLRDQIWWEVGRQLTQDHGWDLSKVDEACVAQLTAPKYGLDSSGRVKVEPKAETKKRLGRSPDDADALLLAFYAPPVMRRARMRYRGGAT